MQAVIIPDGIGGSKLTNGLGNDQFGSGQQPAIYVTDPDGKSGRGLR